MSIASLRASGLFHVENGTAIPLNGYTRPPIDRSSNVIQSEVVLSLKQKISSQPRQSMSTSGYMYVQEKLKETETDRKTTWQKKKTDRQRDKITF